MKIGIIGAGAAGLAAAYDLVNGGHAVTVYESAPFVGGQASTISVGGAPLERGSENTAQHGLAWPRPGIRP